MNYNLQILYQHTLDKYKKYNSRFRKSLKTGLFYEYSEKKQRLIQQRIDKLKQRLLNLKWQVKLAIASGTLAMSLSLSQVNAQQLGPFVPNEPKNPLPSYQISTFANDHPAVVDIDNDGDLDVFIGTNFGTIAFLRNDGTPEKSYFVQQFSTDNPANGIDVGYAATPAFADLDKDGDFDLIIGQSYQYPFSPFNNVQYYENTGTATSPVFTLATGEHPVDNVFSDSYNSHPSFVDIDNDGDLDIFVGGTRNTNYSTYYRETIKFWRNDGSLPVSQFTAEEGATNPISLVNPEFGGTLDHAAPALVDIDADGDKDLFVGDVNGNIRFFRNTGNNTTPDFPSEVTGTGNPFEGINLTSNASPEFADFDNDGDFDAISGSGPYSRLRYFENIGSTTSPNFIERTGIGNPFEGLDFDFNSSPAFADVDNDNDLDVMIGGKYSNDSIRYYQNNNGKFNEVTDTSNPLQEAFPNRLGKFSPAFADLDNDGNVDMLLGLEDRYAYPDTTFLQYYKNNGTMLELQSPSLITDMLPNEVFSPTFGDIDLDGDYDLVLGSKQEGRLRYYENTGDVNSPAFTERTGPDNPFDLVFLDSSPYINFAKPELVDLDHDGDVDLVVGVGDNDYSGDFITEDGTLRYFENQEGVFVEILGTEQPFNNIDVGKDADPAFADIDMDGDLDGFIGSHYGEINYLENQNLAPEVISNITALSFTENDNPVILDAALTLSDDGNDDIISAQIAITNNFLAGSDELTFTAQPGVTGSFDNTTGILSLEGYAKIEVYQAILQSVSYQNTGDNPGSAPRTIEFTAIDFDGTYPSSTSILVNVTPTNDPPQVNTSPQTTQAGSVISIDLCELINDPDNDYTELNISVISTLSGAVTTINDCILSIDYAGTGFSGQDEIVLQACDPSSACDQNTLQIQVEGDPPGPLTIYNAISPNDDGLNDWWEILSLSTPNKIELYNRWGDLVKTLNDYVSQENNLLDDLPSATYFYKIESPQGSYNGYLVIKK